MTTLVTGGTGLLGSHVLDLLVARGEAVRTLVRPGEAVDTRGGSIEIARGDLLDRSSLRSAVAGASRVIHCAARTGAWGPEAEYQLTNVRGLRWLVEAAQSAGVERFVHVSSVAVHGNDIGGTADETAPFRPAPSPYGRSKVAGERLIRQLVRDVGARVTIVRPGIIYGQRDRASFGRFAAMIQANRMTVIGSGRNRLPLIHVEDAAAGTVLAADAGATDGRPYLLVNDEPVTQIGYLSQIALELGVPAPSRHVPYRLALALSMGAETAARLLRWDRPPVTRFGVQLMGGESIFSIQRARSEIGFEPRVRLVDGIARGVAWYRATAGILQTEAA